MVRLPQSSKYRGVSWHKMHRKWAVSIYLRDRETGYLKQKFVGLFSDEVDAALAYNEAAELHGGEGPLNDVSEPQSADPTPDEIAERAAAIRAARFGSRYADSLTA